MVLKKKNLSKTPLFLAVDEKLAGLRAVAHTESKWT